MDYEKNEGKFPNDSSNPTIYPNYNIIVLCSQFSVHLLCHFVPHNDEFHFSLFTLLLHFPLKLGPKLFPRSVLISVF